MSLAALALIEAAAGHPRGPHHLRRAGRAIASSAGRRGRGQGSGLGLPRPRSRHAAGRGGRRASPARPRDGSAARRADRHQGHLRYRRHADRIRLAVLGRPHAARGCRGGRAAARRRRRDHGQDRHHGIRLLPSGQDPQPARSRAHAGRLVERLGGRGRGRAWCRARSARRPTARSSARRRSAAWSASSRRTA